MNKKEQNLEKIGLMNLKIAEDVSEMCSQVKKDGIARKVLIEYICNFNSDNELTLDVRISNYNIR